MCDLSINDWSNATDCFLYNHTAKVFFKSDKKSSNIWVCIGWHDRHHSSLSWRSNSGDAPLTFILYLDLTNFHNDSIVWVWAPVFGSTKFSEWFTVWWINPWSFRELYARHWSLWIVVPISTSLSIIGKSVCRSLFSTMKNRRSVLLSLLQHKPSTHGPVFYFHHFHN